MRNHSGKGNPALSIEVDDMLVRRRAYLVAIRLASTLIGSGENQSAEIQNSPQASLVL
jgi:hypothetical protein